MFNFVVLVFYYIFCKDRLLSQINKFSEFLESSEFHFIDVM